MTGKLIWLWHWLWSPVNPGKLFGFLPVMVWAVVVIAFFSTFAVLETLGVRRVHGMVPLTWVWRCMPRLIDLILFGVGIWHFIFVTTKLPK